MREFSSIVFEEVGRRREREREREWGEMKQRRERKQKVLCVASLRAALAFLPLPHEVRVPFSPDVILRRASTHIIAKTTIVRVGGRSFCAGNCLEISPSSIDVSV